MPRFVRALPGWSAASRSLRSPACWRQCLAFLLILVVTLLLHSVPSPATDDDEESGELKRQQQIVAKFLSVLEKNPRRGTALDRVYGHHVEWGTLDQFVAGLKEKTEKNPQDAASWLLLGLMETQRGHDAEGIDAFRQAETHAPKNALASYYLGLSLNLIGQPEEAVAALERAIERKPPPADLLEIYQQLGRLHQRAQRMDQALQVWSRLETDFPDDARVQEQIAIALLEDGQFAQALPRYEALAQRSKDDYRRTVYSVQAAELRIKLGQRNDGLKHLEATMAGLNPDSWLHRDIRRRIEDVFLRGDDQDGLVGYYEKWLAAHADDVDAMARLARFLARSARVPEATVWLEKALKLAPSRKELRIAFIDQLVDDQRFAEATQQYELLDKSDPNNPDYLRDWGKMILRDKQRPKEERLAAAEAIWNRLAESKPNDPLIAAQVADLYRHQDMQEPALKLYRRAVELAPDDPQYREYLGEYLHLLKRPDEALAVWREIIDGKRRNVTNTTRLAEVLNSFGYQEDAVKFIAEACQLDPKDFSLQLKAAEYHTRALQHPAALEFVAAAGRLAANDDERESVLNERIKVLQADQSLDDEIDRLAVKASSSQSAGDWYVLARYYEADRRQNEATQAIQKALEIDPKSIPSLTAAARMWEQGGDWGAASDRFRQLADVDRRFRSEHLTHVARLEAQLGRTAEALAAGKALIAAAPGNTTNYETYAELCFRLGRPEEGLDTLRKAIRINPQETSLLMMLASKLSDQIRTDEAIQTYWQAFDKAESTDDRIGIVMKLAELHLQINQFDKLVDRLERDRREEDKRRSLTICLAQAHHTAGDFGSARQELESLLSRETRDSELLMQLSKLCEAEQDFDAAVQFQQQLVRVAPGPETEQRLAQLYQSAGNREEASALLITLAMREEEASRRLKIIDGLLRNANYDAAGTLIDGMLREQPQNWELLYRHGVSWASQGRQEEARSKFQRILDLDVPLDALSLAAQERQKQEAMKAKSNIAWGRSSALIQRTTPFSPLDRVYEIQRAIGLQADYYAANAGPTNVWVPSSYGEARMAALGWQLNFENKAGRGDEFVAALQQRTNSDSTPPLVLMDWVYLSSLRQDGKSLFETSRRLAAGGGREEQAFFLNSLQARTQSPNQQNYYDNSPKKQDTTPPLSEDDLNLMMKCIRAVSELDQNLSPNTMQYYRRSSYIASVGKELKRAQREADAERLVDEFADRKQGADLTAACSWAAGEQRVDKALELYERWSKQQLSELNKAGRAQPQNRAGDPTTSLIQLMGLRAFEKANEDVLRVLDRIFEHATAATAITRGRPTRGPAANTQRNMGRQNNVQTWHGEQQNHVQIDYPAANDYLDFNSLWALRQAFESFKRNDVVSDLSAHLKQRAETATGIDRVAALQGVGAVLWWNDEKEEAAQRFIAAAELAPQDQSLKMELAALHFALGDIDAALEMVDSVVPRDQRLLQTREMMALQFAERLGDADRARMAAERLFGVRLDPQTQIALAGHMRRLGLAALADAVTARAQRSSGNQLNAQLTLMTLYQGQGKAKEAIQLAHQVLRRTMSSAVNQTARRNRSYNENDGYRQQALQFLAQTGQLTEMIARLEKMRTGGQETVRMSAQLAELYLASGKRDKALELFAELVERQPDDVAARMQYGQQLEQAGKAAEACDQYLVVLKQRPEFLGDDYYRYSQLFQQANKSRALAEAVETVNLKTAFRHPYYVMNLAQPLLQNKETQDLGVKLFRRAVQEFPAERNYLFQYLHDEAVWNVPEVFELAKQSLVPPKALAVARPWQGLENIYSYDQNGKVNSSVTQVLNSAQRLNRLGELQDAVHERLKESSDWPAGRAILALIASKQGNRAEADRIFRELIDDEQAMKTLPAMGKWIIAQEIDSIPELQPRAIALLEEASSSDQIQNDFSYTPAARLVYLYKAANRREDALKVMREAAKPKPNPGYDQDYQTYRRVSTMTALADQFSNFDSPIDALRLYRELLSQPAQFEIAGRWNGDGGQQIKKRCEAGLSKALVALQGDQAGEGFRILLSSGGNTAPGASAVDLMIMTPAVQDLSKSQLVSAFVDLVKSLSARPELRSSVALQLEQLTQSQPHDVSLAVMRCLIAWNDGPTAVQPAIQNLVQLIEQQPLDDLEPGKRPNSRQRAQALLQVPVWLVARKCLEDPALLEPGEKLANRALAAARRQIDFNFTVSILHEWGQIDWRQNRKEAAERHWADLLEATTIRPKSDRQKAPARAPAPAPKTGPLPTQRTGKIDHPQGFPPIASGRLAGLFAAVIGAPPAGSAASVPQKPAAPDVPESFIPPLTYPQFHATMSLAKLAAERQLQQLSFRAVEEALKGGPPIQVSQHDQNGMMTAIVSGGAVIRRSIPSGAQPGQLSDVSAVTPESFALVARTLRNVAGVWETNRFPADAVYAVLLPQVLPPNRPEEIKIYLEDDGLISGRTASLAATIVPWAQKAQKLGDLKQQIAERSENPTAALSGHVLLTLIALREQDDAAATASLQNIAAILQQDRLPDHQSLACHAAVAGFHRETLRALAAPLLLDLLQARTAQGITLDGELIRRLYRYLGQSGDQVAVQKRLDDYLAARQGQHARHGGDYGLYQQQQDLARTAQVAGTSGLVDLALNYIGRANDIPATGYGRIGMDQPVYSILRQLAARSPEDRYATLSAWTLPAENRQLVRFEMAWNRSQQIPAFFLGEVAAQTPEQPGLTLSTFEQLVAAAKDSGKLNDLAAQLSAAAQEDLPNAKILQLYILMQQGDVEKALPLFKELTSTMEKRLTPPNRNQRNPATARPDYLIARTALAHPEYRAQGKEHARQLWDHARSLFAQDVWMHLHVAQAQAGATELGLPELVPGDDPGLAFWQPVSPIRTTDFAAPAWWFPADGHVVHISGTANDYLVNRFPIAGDFEFSVDTLCAHYAEGNLGYAGVVADGVDMSPRVPVRAIDEHEEINRPDVPERHNEMNRITLQSRDGKVRFLVNGQLAYEETAGRQSPWLTLYAPWAQRAVFSNPRFSGNPVIPREVPLIDGDRMDGWVSSRFQEVQPRRRALAEPVPDDENSRYNNRQEEPTVYDWETKDGELIGNRRDDAGMNVQSRVYYFRPLQPGDRVRYEFFYEPGQTEIHPTLGQVSFLMQPDGIRLHWMTEPNWDGEIFGIEPSNLLDDPAAVKKPGPLPLKPGEWNAVEVRSDGDAVALVLNGQEIYQRVVEPHTERYFGFFRYKDQTAARIRNITLTGNWPETFPAAMMSDAFASQSPASAELRQARHASIGDVFHRYETAAVWSRSQTLPDEERYRFLRDWVLPNDDHLSFRLFTCDLPERIADAPASVRLAHGARVAAPCLELIAAARRLNRLGELQTAVDAVPELSAALKRGKTAFQLMLAAAQKQHDIVAAKAESLSQLVDAIEFQLVDWERYPEYTAVLALLDHPQHLDSAERLTQKLIDKYGALSKDGWDQRLRPLQSAVAARREKPAAGGETAARTLKQWRALPLLTAELRGRGQQPAAWQVGRGEIQQLPGNAFQQLVFESPLTGNFEVTAEISFAKQHEAVLGYGINGISVLPERKGVQSGVLPNVSQKIEKEFPAVGEENFATVRLSVKNGQINWQVNGVEMTAGTLSAVPSPWLVLQGQSPTSQCVIRNVQITGAPTIPSELNLLAITDLANWKADVYGERLGRENDQTAPWFSRGDELVGRLRKDRIIPDLPSLVVHQPPLGDSGELTYEFFYKPDEFEVHPVFGRVCWMLTPAGVRRRQLDNAQWENFDGQGTYVPPSPPAYANASLSLKADDWNTVRLTWRQNQATLSVNGTEVAQDEIDKVAARQFGLFRYSDRHQSRVRNVILKGDWPKTLPAVSEQELASPKP